MKEVSSMDKKKIKKKKKEGNTRLINCWKWREYRED